MADSHPAHAPSEKRINAILGDLIAQRRLLQGSPVDPLLIAANSATIAYWESKLHHSTPDRPPQSHPRRAGGFRSGTGTAVGRA